MTFVPWQLGQCKTWRIIASLDYVGGYSGSPTPREHSRPTPLKHLRLSQLTCYDRREGHSSIGKQTREQRRESREGRAYERALEKADDGDSAYAGQDGMVKICSKTTRGHGLV